MTPAGQESLRNVVKFRSLEKEGAYGLLALQIQKASPTINDNNMQLCLIIAEKAIINAYSERGMAIAKKVFGDSSIYADDLSAFFRVITREAIVLDSYDDRLAFMDSMHGFLLSPSEIQRNYLASLAQGYFLYHLLGLDPKCVAVRRNILENTIWFCDSSVLIPLLAVGSFNHEYVKKIFLLLHDSKGQVYTTPNLLEETSSHLRWAASFVQQYPTKSITFLSAAIVEEPYKQNLFIDGYIRLCADGQIETFDEYLQIVCRGDIGVSSIIETLRSFGISIAKLQEVQGYNTDDEQELVQLSKKLKTKRQSKGTYRNDPQVIAEAEVLLLISGISKKKYRFKTSNGEGGCNFITSSNLFEDLDDTGGRFSWAPKAVYQYLSSFTNSDVDPALLQQANLLAFYSAGVEFIDAEKYEKFFGQMIESSKRDFEREKKLYAEFIVRQYANQGDEEPALDAKFVQTPDLKKPLFMDKVTSELLDDSLKREEIAKNAAQALKAQVNRLEREKRDAWKARESRQTKQEIAH